MQNISTFIEEFQGELNRQCFAYDGTWVKRKRKLDSKAMVTSIFYMIAQRCSSFKSISSLISLNEKFADLDFSASSFCDARKRFPPYIFVDLSQWLYKMIEDKLKKVKWFGRHIFAIDSTNLTLPRQMIEEGFGHEDTGEFYPLATVTVLYDLQLGMIYDSIISQHRSERLNAVQLFRGVPDGGLVIGDRGFFSFELLHEAQKNNVDVLFRIALAHAPEEIQDLLKSTSKDAILTITPSIPTERKLIKHGYPCGPIQVRVLRKKISGKDYILITTILDRSISRQDFFGLYESRWDIEECFKLLKSELQLETFKSKHLNGILQEIFATILLANLAEGLTRLQLGAKTKVEGRAVVSTLEVVRLVRDCFLSIISIKKKAVVKLAEALQAGITKACVRFRPGRSYPRVFWEGISPWTKYAKGIRR